MRCAPPSRWDNLRLSKISHGILQKKTKHRRRGWTHFLVLHPLLRKIQNPSLARLVRNSPSRNANLITKLGSQCRSFQSDIRVFHATMLKVLRHGAIWEELQKKRLQKCFRKPMEVKTNAKVYIAWTLFVHIYSQFNFCHLRVQNAKNGKELKLEKEIGQRWTRSVSKIPKF